MFPFSQKCLAHQWPKLLFILVIADGITVMFNPQRLSFSITYNYYTHVTATPACSCLSVRRYCCSSFASSEKKRVDVPSSFAFAYELMYASDFLERTFPSLVCLHYSITPVCRKSHIIITWLKTKLHNNIVHQYLVFVFTPCTSLKMTSEIQLGTRW